MAIGCGSVVNSASGFYPETVTEQNSRSSGVSFCGRCVLQVTEVCSRFAGLINCGAEFVQCLLRRSAEVITKPVTWLVENRFGLAKLVGLVAIPSQLFPKTLREHSVNCVDQACASNASNDPSKPRYTKVLIKNENDLMRVVICKPPNWTIEKNNRCVLYHNPNGVLAGDCFFPGHLYEHNLTADVHCGFIPSHLQKMRECPVILYDYRGTGMNFFKSIWKRIIHSPTCETVTRDGHAALTYALKHYEKVESYGVSLGGAVAIRSLARFLDANKNFDVSRVSLVAHDSFTSIPRVVCPSVPILSDAVGWLFGAHMDATQPMQSLIKREVNTTILNHTDDRVIPKKARMSEFAKSQPASSVIVLESDEKFSFYGSHGTMTTDMTALLMGEKDH